MDVDNFTETNHPALYYQSMIADQLRMSHYRQAISKVVQPGQVVADLGTGLGILAMMAAQAGAKRVYAIDNRTRSLWIAKRVVQANGLDHQIILMEADARECQLEEPVDVIVNELIGDFGTDENMFECVSAFAKRNLKPGGTILPNHLQTYLVPVQYQQEFRGVWCENFHGLDLRSAIDFPCRPEPIMYGVQHPPIELAKPLLVDDVVFSHQMGERPLHKALQFPITTPGTFQGFVGYFHASLVEGLSLTNYPCYPSCHWQNWNWPISPPMVLHPGHILDVSLNPRVNMVAAGWTLEWKLLETR